MAKKEAKSAKPNPVMEEEANAFAMALLMPAAWLKKDVEKIRKERGGLDEEHVEWLAKRYQVSIVMMTLRLCDLGYRKLHV